jgi:hypothetical protein
VHHTGLRERLPMASVVYHAFCDPAGGSGTDAMTLAIGHREKDNRVVIDLVREVMPRFSPAAVVDEFASTLTRYRVHRLLGDHWGSEFVKEPFRVRGVIYQVADAPKSDLCRDALPMINWGMAGLPDHAKMVTQFAQLERCVSRAGKDSIDHPPGPFHDDIANAVAGCLVTCGASRSLHLPDAIFTSLGARPSTRAAWLQPCNAHLGF